MNYKKLVKQQLVVTKTRVAQWIDWNPDSDAYEAYMDTRRVVIPKPVCDWSFLVCLHEIGHISTGERLYSYLEEYNAEKWAIKRAYDIAGIVCEEYIEDAKLYVKRHLITNLLQNDLKLDKVKPYVLDWMGETKESLMVQVFKQAAQSMGINYEEAVATLNKKEYITI